MSKPIWERQEGEPAKWFARFDRFRTMEPWKRSVNAVFLEENQQKPEETRKESSYRPGKEWYGKASQWKWEERAAAHDKYRRDARDKQVAEKEADILGIEYAQVYERVKALDEQARLIEMSWHDPENKEKIAFQWLTPDKLREWRGCLDDIAKETGGRVRKQELTGKDGGPLEIDYEVVFDGSASEEEERGEVGASTHEEGT